MAMWLCLYFEEGTVIEASLIMFLSHQAARMIWRALLLVLLCRSGGEWKKRKDGKCLASPGPSSLQSAKESDSLSLTDQQLTEPLLEFQNLMAVGQNSGTLVDQRK